VNITKKKHITTQQHEASTRRNVLENKKKEALRRR
jgi:hypothetical protein